MKLEWFVNSIPVLKFLYELGVNYATSEEKYAAFKKKAQRRRLLAKQTQERTEEMVKTITSQLADFAGVTLPEKNQRDQQTYTTLKDTFNAFDKDGSMELGYEEYQESWKFLNRPGSDADIKKAFDAIDVDGTGLVEWNEYVFSLMGEKAINFGTLADLETLHNVLKESEGIMSELRGALVEAKESTKDRVERNAEMRSRLENMKGQMQNQMVSFIFLFFSFFFSLSAICFSHKNVFGFGKRKYISKIVFFLSKN